MSKRDIKAIRTNEANSRTARYGEVEHELGKISSTFHEKTFCDSWIAAVHIATMYRGDIDELAEKRRD
jgi:hypothetical protein